jgi:prepilin-type N-terminal cleavage/methylation domain-containing protein
VPRRFVITGFFERFPRRPKAFTLIEVMITAAVLSFGIILVFRALFVSVDALDAAVDGMRVNHYMGEIFWRMQDDMAVGGSPSQAGKRLTVGVAPNELEIYSDTEPLFYAGIRMYEGTLKYSKRTAAGIRTTSQAAYLIERFY